MQPAGTRDREIGEMWGVGQGGLGPSKVSGRVGGFAFVMCLVRLHAFLRFGYKCEKV